MHLYVHCTSLFSFSATPTTEMYTLSLHDALPILPVADRKPWDHSPNRWWSSTGTPSMVQIMVTGSGVANSSDRKSTRLNSSHTVISYAVFCLKKKKKSQDRCRSERGHIQHGHQK